MGVRVVLLGRLRDLAAGDELILPAPLTWAALLDGVPTGLAEAIREDRIHVALAGLVLADKTSLLAREGDEVALLPPVSGG